jgi:hypothetical protein
MLRLLIADITVEKLSDKRLIILHIRWQGGACSDKTIELPLPIADRLRYSPKIIERVRDLAAQMSDALIAQTLNQEEVRKRTPIHIWRKHRQWFRRRQE